MWSMSTVLQHPLSLACAVDMNIASFPGPTRRRRRKSLVSAVRTCYLSTCTVYVWKGYEKTFSLSHGFIADAYCLLRAQRWCVLVCEYHDVCDKCLPPNTSQEQKQRCIIQHYIRIQDKLTDPGRRKQISVGPADQKCPYYDVMLNHRVGVISGVSEFSQPL